MNYLLVLFHNITPRKFVWHILEYWHDYLKVIKIKIFSSLVVELRVFALSYILNPFYFLVWDKVLRSYPDWTWTCNSFLVSQNTRITSVHHHAQLLFILLKRIITTTCECVSSLSFQLMHFGIWLTIYTSKFIVSMNIDVYIIIRERLF